MKAEAVIYTSKTGFTEQYAKKLGEKLGLPVCALADASKKYRNGATVIYLGWVFANTVKGYKKATRRYKLAAVCAVGLSDTGTMEAEIRKANTIPQKLPLFTLQGGLKRSQLRGINKLLIKILEKGLTAQKARSEQDERMLSLIRKDGSYVSDENLSSVIEWYGQSK